MMNKGNIMRKLLRQPANSSDNVEHSFNDSPQLRPSASQNTVFSASAPIACLDRSPDGKRAVIAGLKVFKILNIDGPTITEAHDLRTIITNYATGHDISAATADRLSIRSVVWSHGAFDTSILTAGTNGRVTIYDLNKLGEGLEVLRIHEHTRQVHKLAINPHRAHWLLSASQDGTVKSFDIRRATEGRNGMVLNSLQTYKGNADAVRDVQWSPINGLEFACSTDAGVIQKWDLRKGTAPVLKLTAHTKACFSIAWHPDGEHIISGGNDQRCHVWDFSKTGERNQKPKYSFDTPAPVSSVSWRPACWSATAQGRRAAQVTVVYDDTNSNKTQNASVHLWDLARPGMPFKQLEQWDSAPTDVLWSTRDLLWSVDREGNFTQTDVAFAPKLIDRRSLSDLSFSATGDLLMVLEERQTPRRPRPSINPGDVPSRFSQSPSGPQLSVSRSDSEDDVTGSFLGPRPFKAHRRHGGRSSQATAGALASNTPTKVDHKVLGLDEAILVTGQYVPQQIMAVGHAPSTTKRDAYQYLTNRYLSRLWKNKSIPYSEQTPDALISSTTEHFAKSAENVGHYRLAQTWRIIGYTIALLLTRRAKFHRKSRLTPKKPTQIEDKELNVYKHDRGEETPRRIPRSKSPADSPLTAVSRSIVAQEMESTSNMTTPLVRPVQDRLVRDTSNHTREPVPEEDNIENDVLALPPPSNIISPSPIPVPGASQSPENDASIEGYDFYGLESISPVQNFPVPQRKQPLRLDYPDPQSSPHRLNLARHDSGESFAMFSTSGDSQSRFISSSDSDVAQSLVEENGRTLREVVESWENNFNSPSRHHRPSIDSDVAPHVSNSVKGDRLNSSNHHHDYLPPTRPSPPALMVQQPSFRQEDFPEVTEVSPLVRPLLVEQISDDPEIIETDYLPWANDPDFVISPIDPVVLVKRTIQFEVQTGSLNAAAIILLLNHLLPSKTLDSRQSSAILRQYHHRLQSMQLFTEATLLRNICTAKSPWKTILLSKAPYGDVHDVAQ
ncbi:WD repeat-containing protein C4F8.11 [Phlyctema vagabunda]|uniref:WD repeat-containing protein C4F8.11 n=1 Tax=Phlyctema vagabunda TaxID=108571 RepID=A0ABR4PPX3_9HELO